VRIGGAKCRLSSPYKIIAILVRTNQNPNSERRRDAPPLTISILGTDVTRRFLKPYPLAPLPKGEGNQILLLLALWARRLGGEGDLLSM
jgi:hypothetical protein